MQDLVAAVRYRGYRVVIITNGHPEIQRGKIEATAAAATVSDHIIIGGDEVAAGRQEKPHPGIFHRACQLAACQPHEVSQRFHDSFGLLGSGGPGPHSREAPRSSPPPLRSSLWCRPYRHVVLWMPSSGKVATRSLLSVQALHIGDSLASDIQGGINAGLGATVWVNPSGMAAPAAGPHPTFTVTHVTDLLPVLDQLSAPADDR